VFVLSLTKHNHLQQTRRINEEQHHNHESLSNRDKERSQVPHKHRLPQDSKQASQKRNEKPPKQPPAPQQDAGGQQQQTPEGLPPTQVPAQQDVKKKKKKRRTEAVKTGAEQPAKPKRVREMKKGEWKRFQRMLGNPLKPKTKRQKRKSKILYPKRGWISKKVAYLFIPDVIDYCVNVKKMHPAVVYQPWLWSWKNRLQTKGILFCWQLNDFPYGVPWRNLALTRGLFNFLEKVREGKHDDVLAELAKLKPKPEPPPTPDDGSAPVKRLKIRRGGPIRWEKRTYPVRMKIIAHKKQKRQEKLEGEQRLIREAEEALVKACTPAWLIKLQQEKEAKAAAAKGGKKKGK